MSAVAGPSSKPVAVTYCGVCSLPTEYCEFGSRVSKCKAWLEGVNTVEYERIWGEGGYTSAWSGVGGRERLTCRYACGAYWYALD
jgi:hypothetical protein